MMKSAAVFNGVIIKGMLHNPIDGTNTRLAFILTNSDFFKRKLVVAHNRFMVSPDRTTDEINWKIRASAAA